MFTCQRAVCGGNSPRGRRAWHLLQIPETPQAVSNGRPFPPASPPLLPRILEVVLGWAPAVACIGLESVTASPPGRPAFSEPRALCSCSPSARPIHADLAPYPSRARPLRVSSPLFMRRDRRCFARQTRAPLDPAGLRPASTPSPAPPSSESRSFKFRDLSKPVGPSPAAAASPGPTHSLRVRLIDHISWPRPSRRALSESRNCSSGQLDST